MLYVTQYLPYLFVYASFSYNFMNLFLEEKNENRTNKSTSLLVEKKLKDDLLCI